MQRRDFLRTACQACGALALLPAAASLESCSTTKSLSLTAKDGVLDIPLSRLDPEGRTMVKAKGLADKLLVVRLADGTYAALVLNCPHKNGPVAEKGGVLTCAWHGSTFDQEGKVTKGPAKTDLARYPAEVQGEFLRLTLA